VLGSRRTDAEKMDPELVNKRFEASVASNDMDTLRGSCEEDAGRKTRGGEEA
jgi:hypothetical protein